MPALRIGRTIMETDMKRILAAAILGIISTGAFAGGQFQQGGNGPLLVETVMMGIKTPAGKNCPANAKLKAWVYTNRGGTIRYMMIRHGQGAGTVQTAVAKKVNGKYVAEISKNFTIQQPIDAQYRIAARGANQYQFSNWVPVKRSC